MKKNNNLKFTTVKKTVKKVPFLPKDSNKSEIKYFDTTSVSSNCSTTGTITQLNNIGQGLVSQARVGNKVHLTSCDLRLIVNDNSAPVTDAIVRVLIVYDTETDGALPSVGGSLTSNSILDNTNGLSPTSFRNPNNLTRYKILCDEIINHTHGSYQSVTGTTTTLAPAKSWLKKSCSLNTFSQYNDGLASITSINSGAMYIVLLSDIASGTNAPIIAYQHRLYFTDS